MILEYLPNQGFKIDSQLFEWGEDRSITRKKLENQHQEDDRLIEMAQFFDGDESKNIIQKRDIYQDIHSSKSYFCFRYDEKNCLHELELHSGMTIKVGEVELEFEKDIDNYVSELGRIEQEVVELEEGDFLFKNLKMTLSNAEAKGGEGNGLYYFYASSSIDHLE